MIRFIEEHIKAPVTLVGNSMGGHVGLITALARPDLVKHLVLTGSSGLYERTFGDSFPRKVIKLISKEKQKKYSSTPKWQRMNLWTKFLR